MYLALFFTALDAAPSVTNIAPTGDRIPPTKPFNWSMAGVPTPVPAPNPTTLVPAPLRPLPLGLGLHGYGYGWS